MCAVTGVVYLGYEGVNRYNEKYNPHVRFEHWKKEKRIVSSDDPRVGFVASKMIEVYPVQGTRRWTVYRR